MIYQADGHLIDHLMEAPDLNANVDMARLLNDAFVMVDQITGGAQHNPLLNDGPIIQDHPNVGGHVE
jgi:hypothetical protein